MGKHWRETFKTLGKGDKKALKSPRAKRKGKALRSDSETLRAKKSVTGVQGRRFSPQLHHCMMAELLQTRHNRLQHCSGVDLYYEQQVI